MGFKQQDAVELMQFVMGENSKLKGYESELLSNIVLDRSALLALQSISSLREVGQEQIAALEGSFNISQPKEQKKVEAIRKVMPKKYPAEEIKDIQESLEKKVEAKRHEVPKWDYRSKSSLPYIRCKSKRAWFEGFNQGNI